MASITCGSPRGKGKARGSDHHGRNIAGYQGLSRRGVVGAHVRQGDRVALRRRVNRRGDLTGLGAIRGELGARGRSGIEAELDQLAIDVPLRADTLHDLLAQVAARSEEHTSEL